MDIETAEAIDGVRADINVLRDELHSEVAGLRAELHSEVTGLRAELRSEVAGLRAELHDGRAQNRRHFEVLAESLRDDIRIVAEGVVSLGAKVDSLLRPGGRG